MEQAALLEKRDRTVPGYSTFSPMDTWRRCIIYHLIYHHTLSLHLNHLLLLHTYVLGIFVVAISIHLYFLFSVVSLFCIFEVTFARCTIHGWSHALLVVVPLGLLAWTAATQLVPLQSLGTKIFCGFFFVTHLSSSPSSWPSCMGGVWSTTTNLAWSAGCTSTGVDLNVAASVSWRGCLGWS